jgi:hypothetical protein
VSFGGSAGPGVDLGPGGCCGAGVVDGEVVPGEGGLVPAPVTFGPASADQAGVGQDVEVVSEQVRRHVQGRADRGGPRRCDPQPRVGSGVPRMYGDGPDGRQ